MHEKFYIPIADGCSAVMSASYEKWGWNSIKYTNRKNKTKLISIHSHIHFILAPLLFPQPLPVKETYKNSFIQLFQHKTKYYAYTHNFYADWVILLFSGCSALFKLHKRCKHWKVYIHQAGNIPHNPWIYLNIFHSNLIHANPHPQDDITPMLCV